MAIPLRRGNSWVSGAVAVAVAAAAMCGSAASVGRSCGPGRDRPPRAILPCGRVARPALQLRGGSCVGGGAGAFSDASRGVADEDEFFRKFGSGPGSMDLSSSRFEVRPDSFNDTDSLMDGAGLWDYPEEYRLLGEHIPPRVGHRVRTSPYLRVSLVLLHAAGFIPRPELPAIPPGPVVPRTLQRSADVIAPPEVAGAVHKSGVRGRGNGVRGLQSSKM
jgi:hypothetical protein